MTNRQNEVRVQQFMRSMGLDVQFADDPPAKGLRYGAVSYSDTTLNLSLYDDQHLFITTGGTFLPSTRSQSLLRLRRSSQGSREALLQRALIHNCQTPGVYFCILEGAASPSGVQGDLLVLRVACRADRLGADELKELIESLVGYYRDFVPGLEREFHEVIQSSEGA